MSCYRPLQAYQILSSVTSTGKSIIVFSPPSDPRDRYENIKLPCGCCVGCRLEYSRQWAVRCLHESKLYQYERGNCFITLTFSDKALLERQRDSGVDPRSLDVRDFQLFMKRLRKKFGIGIRFFHCGEYGDQYGRPHYHACIFNFDFPDKKSWKVIKGNQYYRSASLEELWPYGNSSISELNFQTAAYCARYIMKKRNGKNSFAHYVLGVEESTGEILTKRKEYVTMSRRPGIGKRWFDKYRDQTYRDDSVVVRGRKMRPPKYYDSQYELYNPDELKRIKDVRKAKALEVVDDNTKERLLVKEKVSQGKLDFFSKRGDL